jgi:hypothetical protein
MNSIESVLTAFCMLAALLLATAVTTEAFAVAPPKSWSLSKSTTELAFGVPSFLTPKNEGADDDGDAKAVTTGKEKGGDEKKLGVKGLLQLIAAGAGAPFLGDFEGVDKETGKFMFSLEANNLVDENGKSKQTSMPYFESGWVDPEDEKRAAEGFKFPWQK